MECCLIQIGLPARRRLVASPGGPGWRPSAAAGCAGSRCRRSAPSGSAGRRRPGPWPAPAGRRRVRARVARRAAGAYSAARWAVTTQRDHLPALPPGGDDLEEQLVRGVERQQGAAGPLVRLPGGSGTGGHARPGAGAPTRPAPGRRSGVGRGADRAASGLSKSSASRSNRRCPYAHNCCTRATSRWLRARPVAPPPTR